MPNELTFHPALAERLRVHMAGGICTVAARVEVMARTSQYLERKQSWLLG